MSLPVVIRGPNRIRAFTHDRYQKCMTAAERVLVKNEKRTRGRRRLEPRPACGPCQLVPLGPTGGLLQSLISVIKWILFPSGTIQPFRGGWARRCPASSPLLPLPPLLRLATGPVALVRQPT